MEPQACRVLITSGAHPAGMLACIKLAVGPVLLQDGLLLLLGSVCPSVPHQKWVSLTTVTNSSYSLQSVMSVHLPYLSTTAFTSAFFDEKDPFDNQSVFKMHGSLYVSLKQGCAQCLPVSTACRTPQHCFHCSMPSWGH